MSWWLSSPDSYPRKYITVQKITNTAPNTSHAFLTVCEPRLTNLPFSKLTVAIVFFLAMRRPHSPFVRPQRSSADYHQPLGRTPTIHAALQLHSFSSRIDSWVTKRYNALQ